MFANRYFATALGENRSRLQSYEASPRCLQESTHHASLVVTYQSRSSLMDKPFDGCASTFARVSILMMCRSFSTTCLQKKERHCSVPNFGQDHLCSLWQASRSPLHSSALRTIVDIQWNCGTLGPFMRWLPRSRSTSGLNGSRWDRRALCHAAKDIVQCE